MSDLITIRPIKREDFEAVAALLAELGRPALTDASRPALREVFERHVAADRTASLLALRGDHAVGVVTMELRQRLNWPTPEAWIPDLIVTESEHGRGAGPALLREAIAIARRRGCHRLTLESGDHRKRAHRFYAREGLTDAGKYFVLDLG